MPGTADSSFGVHGRIGYRSAEMLAEEIQFEWQNGFDLSRGGEVDAWALTLNLRWQFIDEFNGQSGVKLS